LLTLCLVLPAPAQTPPKDATDAHGDPLPKYVRARLGTIRFRQGSPVTSLRYAADGKTLISSGTDQSLRMWDAKTGKELFSFGGAEVLRNAFQGGSWSLSPDGKLLAVMDSNQFVKLYEVATGKQLHQLGQSQ